MTEPLWIADRPSNVGEVVPLNATDAEVRGFHMQPVGTRVNGELVEISVERTHERFRIRMPAPMTVGADYVVQTIGANPCTFRYYGTE